jgi:S1-C subfamily serine protease
MPILHQRFFHLVLCVPLLAQLPAAPASAQTTPKVDASALVGKAAAPLVTVKFVLAMDSEESEGEATGTMVSGDGVVLLANDALGGFASMMGASITPKNIKVLVGDDTQGVDAKLVARDTELNLAWLRIDTPPATPYAFVDFAASTDAAIGEDLFVVRKMNKYFGRTPQVVQTTVSALTTKPRKLLIPSTSNMSNDRGIPVYNAAGKVVGLTTILLPEREEMQMRDESLMRDLMVGMILPAKDIADATKNAMETAAANPAPEPPPASAPAPTQPTPAEQPAAPK